MTTFDRNTLTFATIKERYPLTQERSTKETWHVTLNLTGVNLPYEPGDSVGICAQNDPILVEHLIQAMEASSEDQITHKRSGEKMSLKTFLTCYANLSRLTSSFLKLIHERENCQRIGPLLLPENKPDLRTFLAKHDPLHLLRDYANTPLPLQELCDQFGPLLPRFYSVASSKYHQRDCLDLTVALFTWMQGNDKRYGVASHFLCHLAEIEKTPIPLFVQPAPHFRLPKAHDTPIIMIGPGTGIAPFRAFIQERHHHGATGKHWLFFGERNQKSDFFYEKDWKQYEHVKIHTAFSRDQQDKLYVQHRMLEHAKEFYQWLENGAYLYVCGDAKVMAKDVEKTLLHIIAEQGNKNETQAKDYLKALRKARRYLLDIY